MNWLQFVMNLDSLDPTDVEDAFLRLGACSVTLSDAGDDPGREVRVSAIGRPDANELACFP